MRWLWVVGPRIPSTDWSILSVACWPSQQIFAAIRRRSPRCTISLSRIHFDCVPCNFATDKVYQLQPNHKDNYFPSHLPTWRSYKHSAQLSILAPYFILPIVLSTNISQSILSYKIITRFQCKCTFPRFSLKIISWMGTFDIILW